MITRNRYANSGVCALWHSLPGAAASKRALRADPDSLARIAFAKVPDHLPETVSFTSLDHLERRRAVELLVRSLQPLADCFGFNKVGQCVE